MVFSEGVHLPSSLSPMTGTARSSTLMPSRTEQHSMHCAKSANLSPFTAYLAAIMA